MGKGKRAKKIIGTPERPRLSVYRSLKHMHVQIVDDLKGKTLASLSTLKMKKKGGNLQAAKTLGGEAAKLAQSKGIKKIVFDRGNFIYHGRVKAMAEAMREGGLEF